ncbi:uncharacterized protein LOC134205922 [Armigeres subalbatus]|uniref:uncharacterized protein LOC134205922 n=1 Tax=Armigeres subalbatus TaxID=124917 RepID=UPI002ED31EA3
MYYQNVGGMNGLVEDYRLAVMDHCYDIIVLTETWLDCRTISSYIFGTGHEVFRCDRNSNNSRKSTGGGIIIAVSSRLKASVIEDDSFNTVEQVWVSIQLGGRKLFVCAVYIPPDRTRDLELIDTHCRSVFLASEIASPNDEIIVLGDFNLAGVAWAPTHNSFLRPDQEHSSFHPGALRLLDNYSTATLSQVNCIVNENNRLLDVCFVGGRYTAPFISTAPVPLVKAAPHHPSLIIGVENDDVRDYVGTSTAVSYVFGKANYCSIAEVRSNLDWQSILDPADANIAAQTFSHVLAYVINRHVPKKIAHTESTVPWMTNDLRSLKRTKKAVLKRFTRFRTLPLKHHYARLNHEYKRLSRFYFKRYQRRIRQRLKSHPKSFWNYVNEQRKEVGLPSSMVYNRVMASTQQEICNLFSAKFASVFVNERLSNDSITSAAGNVPLTNQTLKAVDVSTDTIARAATRLKTSYKSGPDGVLSVFLKTNISCRLDPLHRIFQLSLSNGVFLSCWKTAEMFPVYKKGSKRDINNYRGITSLCAVSKLFELVVMDSLNGHCKHYISTDQHDFMKKRSTCTNLLCLTSYVTYCL